MTQTEREYLIRMLGDLSAEVRILTARLENLELKLQHAERDLETTITMLKSYSAWAKEVNTRLWELFSDATVRRDAEFERMASSLLRSFVPKGTKPS